MRLALRLAVKGKGRVAPNPLVGAIVVKDGVIIGRGYHRAYGADHAEVMALKEAGEEARGATMVVTLEPCNHFGHTPPCTQAIIKAGIRRVVFGMKDPNPSVAGGGSQALRENGILVIENILEEKCQKLNESFIHFVSHKTPFVTLKTAATLDGKIATHTGDSRWITGEKSRRRVHRLRGEMDAVMVGVGTALKDDPLLTCRLPGAWRQPLRIVIDTHLKLPLSSNLVRSCQEAPLLIVIGPEVPAGRREVMASRGIEILESPLYNDRVDLKKLMINLGERLITSILLEGGSELNASALAAGIVQKVLFFYAAKILGGQGSLSMIGGPSPGALAAAIPLRSCSVRRSGEDFLMEGYVEKTDTD